MPYPRNTYFNPSGRYKQTWSLVPQVRTVSVSGHKTKSLYSDLSPAIPIFYILMFLAISFDVYLGFSILAKSGVSIALIVGSVLADLLLAIAPFLIESYLFKDWNHVVLENQIFQKELECKTMKNEETVEEFQVRRSIILEGDLRKFSAYKRNGKILRSVLIIGIFAIAFWKIYTFLKVIPPGINIFSLVNGKIVIIFSLLCAIFHLLGSEKAVAHLSFYFVKGPEFKKYNRTNIGQKPEYQPNEVEYKGKYADKTSGNTRIVNRDGKTYLEYIHIVQDDEIQELINAQTDENAKRGVAIKCKETQII